MADANLQPRRAFGAAALAKWRAAFSRSADYGDQTLFRSATFRWLWRIYCHRLTSAGRWFLWPSIIFTMYGGVSLRLQGYLVWSYIFGLWAAALLAMWLLRPRVRLTAWQAGRICAGEVLPVDIELEQTGRSAPTTIHVIPHRLAHALLPEPAEGVAVGPLRRGQRRRLRLGLRCLRRGVYTLNGYRVETDQPFGLLHASRRFESRQQLMVYPAFQRLTRLELPTGRRYHPGGVALASSIGESFEYIGNREYRDGDNLRDIDWRATARLCRPIVREYRDEYFLRVAIILDTHIPRRSSQSARDGFERAVSITAAVADFMARQEYLVDLFAAGPNLYHLTAGRSLAYLDQILDILACVEENPQEPFDIIEPEIFEQLSKITTVICVFLDWNDSRRAFVNRLARQGAGVKVVVVRDGPCTLPPLEDATTIGPVCVIDAEQYRHGLEEL